MPIEIWILLCLGLHSVEHRMPLWTHLGSLAPSCNSEKLLLLGDLNAFLYTDDRMNGNPVTSSEIRDLTALVSDLQLTELKSSGSFFSWSSKVRRL